MKIASGGPQSYRKGVSSPNWCLCKPARWGRHTFTNPPRGSSVSARPDLYRVIPY